MSKKQTRPDPLAAAIECPLLVIRKACTQARHHILELALNIDSREARMILKDLVLHLNSIEAEAASMQSAAIQEK